MVSVHGTCRVRRLIIVLGDQLTTNVPAFDGFNPSQDCVWMAEVDYESTKVWSHKARIVLFLSAMRHFKAALVARDWPVVYWQLDNPDNLGTLSACLARSLNDLQPEEVWYTEPGEWQIDEDMRAVLTHWGGMVKLNPDTTFLASKDDFSRHARGRKQLRMEYFYRGMRQRYGVLLDENHQPEGGKWNYDADNRRSFGKNGPDTLAEPVAFLPDEITQAVVTLVKSRFPEHPGCLDAFDWPVTSSQAEALLEDFLQQRLPVFGRYQDAMWAPTLLSPGSAYLAHSKLSAAINLKLLHPLKVVQAAENAYRNGDVDLASAEGFIRQILGWREFIRGMYWRYMPDYLTFNALDAHAPLPALYWTGATDMMCLRHTISQTLAYGYAHHIQRLMVTGLYGLLLGVSPKELHEWYLAVYVDAVEWVELPNTIGMSQFADGGLFASKPYIASGKYIQKMSNYCDQCVFKPDVKTGPLACPMTTLYWAFLIRHFDRFEKHPRLALQMRNVHRLSVEEKTAITEAAEKHRHDVAAQSL